MKINITFDLSEDVRMAIARHHGVATRPASYGTCKWNIIMLVETHFEDLINELTRTEENERELIRIREEYEATKTKERKRIEDAVINLLKGEGLL